MQKSGLNLQANAAKPRFGLLFMVLAIGMAGVLCWYGYRYYTTGESLPIPMPFVAANPHVDESTVTKEQLRSHSTGGDKPKYLSIPALNIQQARVCGVDVLANGELGTPHNINDIGWYGKSSLPGSGGPMLMDGHNGGPTRDGVFKRLGELKSGDEIVITRGDNEEFRYTVQEVKHMSVDELNNGHMQTMTKAIAPGREGLNLITCTGNWVPAKQTYDQRVTIRASLAV